MEEYLAMTEEEAAKVDASRTTTVEELEAMKAAGYRSLDAYRRSMKEELLSA